MIQRLKDAFHKLSQDKPGERFMNHYRRRQKALKDAAPWESYLFIGVGVALGIIGLLLSIPPGSPGFLLWVPALGLIAARLKFFALFLDKLESISRTIYGRIKGKLSR